METKVVTQPPVYYVQLGDVTHGTFAVSLVDDPAIESDFIALSANNDPDAIMLAAADKEKRMVTGPVLIPGKHIMRLDKRGNPFEIVFSAEVIEASRNRYARDHGNFALTHQHEMGLKGRGYVVEQWIITDPEKDKAAALGLGYLPAGTWMLSVKIEDDEYWQQEVKGGKVKGFSIEGIYNQALKMAEKEVEKIAKISRGNPVANLLRKAAELLERKPQSERAEPIRLMTVNVDTGDGMVALTFPEEPPFELMAVDEEGNPVGKITLEPVAAAEPEPEEGVEMKAAKELADMLSTMQADLVKLRAQVDKQNQVLSAAKAPSLPKPAQDQTKKVEPDMSALILKKLIKQ